MNRCWPIIALAALSTWGFPARAQNVATAQAAQLASDVDAWGEPVEGIQLSLGASKNSPQRLGALPDLDLKIRTADLPVLEPRLTRENFSVELDGVWYTNLSFMETHPGCIDCLRGVVGPGKESAVIPVSFWPPTVVLNPNMKRVLSQPGKHSVRVKVNVTRSRQSSVDTESSIILVSNEITIGTADTASARPEAEGWGDPVDGIQLHLALSQDMRPQFPGELPPLEVQMRNLGADTFTFPLDGLVSAIEMDGIWYGLWSFGNLVAIQGPVPGAQSQTFHLQQFLVEHSYELEANGKGVRSTKLDLKPGHHSVRVRTCPLKTETSNDQAISLVSNEIAVEIPGFSPAAGSPASSPAR